MRIALDANVLFYAIDVREPDKRGKAGDLLRRGVARDMILPTQALGEFLNAVRRKRPESYDEAVERAVDWSRLYPVVPTEPEHVLRGAGLVQRHKLQFWDAVLLATAEANGVDLLLTEDMQDGATIDGVAILDPFKPANRARLDEVLS